MCPPRPCVRPACVSAPKYWADHKRRADPNRRGDHTGSPLRLLWLDLRLDAVDIGFIQMGVKEQAAVAGPQPPSVASRRLKPRAPFAKPPEGG